MKMREIRIEKIVINVGIKPDEKVENPIKILEELTGCKPVPTKSKKRSTFNVPKGRTLGCKVTIRKNQYELLKRLLNARDNKLLGSNFDETGNFCFGVEEYITVPGMKYNPYIGMFGFDVCVSLERPGFRVKRRKVKSKIGKKHLITKKEAIEFVKKTFGTEVMEDA